MSIIDGNQSGKISKVYIDGILLMLCLRGPMPFLQVCTRLCRGQSCVRYALRGPLPPRIRVCGPAAVSYEYKNSALLSGADGVRASEGFPCAAAATEPTGCALPEGPSRAR